jgi:hypothetical protein
MFYRARRRESFIHHLMPPLDFPSA